MYHILKAGVILSFEKTTGSDQKLVEEVSRAGFERTGKEGRIFVFTKKENTPESSGKRVNGEYDCCEKSYHEFLYGHTPVRSFDEPGIHRHTSPSPSIGTG